MFNMVMERAFGKRLSIARLCLITTLFFTIIGSTHFAWAEDFDKAPVIFDVRRSLPLEPDEEVYHDFYISAGSEAGFKKGMFVTVVRPLPIHDPIQNKQQATLNVSVAHLQVIQTGKAITVARLYSEMSNEERPTLEFEAVMVGDRVDLSSLTSEAPPTSKSKDSSKSKRKTSASEGVLDSTVDAAGVVSAAASAPVAAPVSASVPSTEGAPTPLVPPATVPAVVPASVPAGVPPAIVPAQKVEVPVPPPPPSAAVSPRAA